MKRILVLPALCLAFALSARAQQAAMSEVAACNVVSAAEASSGVGFPLTEFKADGPDMHYGGENTNNSHCDMKFKRDNDKESRLTFAISVHPDESAAAARFADIKTLPSNRDPMYKFEMKLSAEIGGLGNEAIVLEQVSRPDFPSQFRGYIVYWRHGAVIDKLHVTDQGDRLLIDPDALISLAKVIDAKGVATVNVQ